MILQWFNGRNALLEHVGLFVCSTNTPDSIFTFTQKQIAREGKSCTSNFQQWLIIRRTDTKSIKSNRKCVHFNSAERFRILRRTTESSFEALVAKHSKYNLNGGNG